MLASWCIDGVQSDIAAALAALPAAKRSPSILNLKDVLFHRHLLLHSRLGTTKTRTVAAHCAHGSLQCSWYEQDKRRGTLLTKKKKKKLFALQVVLPHCARASRRLHRALAVF
jgi:hypothetical protein